MVQENNFMVREIDSETVIISSNVSIVKQTQEKVEEGVEAILWEVEEGVEAILMEYPAAVKNQAQNRESIGFKFTKLRIKQKAPVQEVESLFSESDIQKVMAQTEEKKEGLNDKEINKKFNLKLIKDPKLVVKPTNSQIELSRVQSSEKTLPSSKKVWLAIGIAVLANAIIYALFGGVAAMLFACGTVCLGVVCSHMFSKDSISEVKKPESFIAESRIMSAMARSI